MQCLHDPFTLSSSSGVCVNLLEGIGSGKCCVLGSRRLLSQCLRRHDPDHLQMITDDTFTWLYPSISSKCTVGKETYVLNVCIDLYMYMYIYIYTHIIHTLYIYIYIYIHIHARSTHLIHKWPHQVLDNLMVIHWDGWIYRPRFRIRMFCGDGCGCRAVQWQWLRSEVEEMDEMETGHCGGKPLKL